LFVDPESESAKVPVAITESLFDKNLIVPDGVDPNDKEAAEIVYTPDSPEYSTNL
jgi:hypothetical protein